MPKYRINPESNYKPKTAALIFTFNRINFIKGDYSRGEWIQIIYDHKGALGGWTDTTASGRAEKYFRYGLQAGFIILA